MKEEWLFPNAIVPVDIKTTAALVAEIKRLIDVVGGMALAQPKQEPVVFNTLASLKHKKTVGPIERAMLNTTPPQRTWVGLNDDEIDYLIHLAYTGDEEFVQTIEAKLKEKNT